MTKNEQQNKCKRARNIEHKDFYEEERFMKLSILMFLVQENSNIDRKFIFEKKKDTRNWLVFEVAEDVIEIENTIELGRER